jgi:hypothetical protein
MFSSTLERVKTHSFYERKASKHSPTVYLVNKGDFLYKKGRILAEDVYREVWNTEKLVDGNDYGIVIANENQIVGNANIQMKTHSNLLKSEVFFQEKHWANYIEAYPLEVAEMSGLAVHRSLDLGTRQLVMMLLFTGVNLLCSECNIQFLVSIQRRALSRMLTKKMKLPFFLNEAIEQPSQELPRDKYWDGGEIPRLYYLETMHPTTQDAIRAFALNPNTISSAPKYISLVRDNELYNRINEFEPANLLAALV